MLVVSILVSTLTTQIKQQEHLHFEMKREKMHANLLRAIAHDIRTPLASIVGASSTLLEQELSVEDQASFGLKISQTMMGRGTATQELLSMRGLNPTEKAIMATVADRETTEKLIRQTKIKLYIDIPGSGIMVAVPVKSVGGAETLAYLTDNKQPDSGKPEFSFQHELIYVILNEGHSDEVMDAARSAGATGGTVVTAKGTGVKQTEKFRRLSLTNEKEIILIVAKASVKGDIMRAIIEKAGTQTKAGAICFSLPVSHVAGLRTLEEG